ncbi:ribosomal protein S10 [Aulographum hederae CBS 113979]|uniref:Small ribosomal subunit protein uS10m n=1 Tax=Aulographum hederae CBS 113979 TaxID=1176131 RepID=A0A6G1GYS5_9PEZI|nr:ribosomal protein S10 [Aulographum hederae CBS 113979]
MATPSLVRWPFGVLKRLKANPPPIWRRPQRAQVTTEALQGLARERGIPVDKSLPALDPETKSTLQTLPLPLSLQSAYLTPLRRTAPHGVPTCNLQLRSYSPRLLEFYADFCMRAAYYLSLPAIGPIPLPRKKERWTVPRSNFIHKKSQENFERITYRRLIQIQDGHHDAVKRWLGYLEEREMAGVGGKADWWHFDSGEKRRAPRLRPWMALRNNERADLGAGRTWRVRKVGGMRKGGWLKMLARRHQEGLGGMPGRRWAEERRAPLSGVAVERRRLGVLREKNRREQARRLGKEKGLKA